MVSQVGIFAHLRLPKVEFFKKNNVIVMRMSKKLFSKSTFGCRN